MISNLANSSVSFGANSVRSAFDAKVQENNQTAQQQNAVAQSQQSIQNIPMKGAVEAQKAPVAQNQAQKLDLMA